MAYGHRWVEAALMGTEVKYLGRGDADFRGMSYHGRADAVKKGTVFLNVFMYALQNMRLAVSECGRPCEKVCDDDDDDCYLCDEVEAKVAGAWDRAVALYVGSLEGKEDESQFLYQLAETRCQNFGTCGWEGKDLTGTSNVNLRIMKEFTEGQQRLSGKGNGHCERVENHMSRIWKLMAVPMIQGTLRYAHKMDEKTTTEWDVSKEKAEKRNSEGATFAAAILPRLWACNPDDAEVLYGNMRIGAVHTDFKTVKSIFEANYECLGVTCVDVGGIIAPDTSDYFKWAMPCVETGTSNLNASTRSQSGSGKTAGIVFGAIIGAVVALMALCFFYKRTQVMKSGKETPDMGNPDVFASEGARVTMPSIDGTDEDNELCML
uniref:Uncharacterized protein n=1 Tax=Odontella aurita TaxID=265563 RepID=A0A7S4ML94_9STRA|mmetsp:Transcript_25186/g.73942  ORF Transcript_25186/g.73942 Transcript_25186/m.73942 type:complete len:377 (+) Transcript_25186:1270-2400(+)